MKFQFVFHVFILRSGGRGVEEDYFVVKEIETEKLTGSMIKELDKEVYDEWEKKRKERNPKNMNSLLHSVSTKLLSHCIIPS